MRCGLTKRCETNHYMRMFHYIKSTSPLTVLEILAKITVSCIFLCTYSKPEGSIPFGYLAAEPKPDGDPYLLSSMTYEIKVMANYASL